MASTQAYQKINLTPDDVPGAKLNIDVLEKYGNVSLRRWLECRGLKTAGNKSDLLQRCKDAVSADKSEFVDPTVDGGKWCSIKDEKIKREKKDEKVQPVLPPITGWRPFPSKNIPTNFNYGHIYHYLLESVVLINENGESEDTDLAHMTSKPLTKGEQYVKSGSVTNVMDTEGKGHYYVKAKVAASMKNEDRNVNVTISMVSGAVLDASCTCAGSALGRCNHVAAVLLLVDKHCKEYGNDAQACTSKPCEWNKRKRSHRTPGKVSEAAYTSYQPKQIKLSDFDPRPESMRSTNDENLNCFVTNLKYSGISRGKNSMWESLLKTSYQDYEISKEREGILRSQVDDLFNNIKRENVHYQAASLYMIANTKSQAESNEWHASRWFRITASTAKQANNLGNLLNYPGDDVVNMKRFKAFIRNSIWGINQYSSPDMMYGVENEDQARSDYTSYMKLKTPYIEVEKTGFWVNNLWPELGCSPDGLVTDPVEVHKHGLLEIKCLKIFREVAPKDLFGKLDKKEIKRSDLYSSCFGIPLSDNTSLELKTSHIYYFQIQFQMAITGRNWCDFVLWSPVGPPNVERIRRDEQLIKSMLGNVTTLWIEVIAPEIFEMRVPKNLNPILLKR